MAVRSSIFGLIAIECVQRADQGADVDAVSGSEFSFAQVVIRIRAAHVVPEAKWNGREIRSFLAETSRPEGTRMGGLDGKEFLRTLSADDTAEAANPGQVVGAALWPFTGFPSNAQQWFSPDQHFDEP